MTTIELKAQLHKEIEDEQNTTILKRMQAYYRRLKSTPCQYTQEELEQRLDIAELEAEQGKGITQEQMEKLTLEWQA